MLSVLSRPKHTAVLAYLAVASPRGFHRRDKVAALFWPEADQERARTSLRGAVHYLRRSLGEDVVLSRGDEEIGLDWEQLACDAVDFQRAVEEGDAGRALDLYRGDLLEGFFLSGCREFEQWLDEERLRLRELAAVAAWTRAHEHLGAGRITDAERTGQRALGLVATDENEARRFIGALAEAGDRAAAVRFYERFAEILKGTLDLDPSPETQALESAIRRSALPAEEVGPPGEPEGPGGPEESVETAGAAAAHLVTAEVETPEAGVGEKTGPVEPPARVRRPRGGAGIAVMGLALLSIGLWLGRGKIDAVFSNGDQIAEADLVSNRVLVTFFENQTGDDALDPTGRMAAEFVHDELVRTGVMDVVDLGPAFALAEEGVDPTSIRAEAAAVGAAFAVTGAIFAQGDGLLIQGQVLDVAMGRNRAPLGPVTMARNEPAAALSEVARRAGGAVPFLLHPANAGRDFTPPRSYAAYAEWEAGHDAFEQWQFEEAATRMARAFELDSTFIHPLIVQTWALWMSGLYPEADSVYRISEGLRDGSTDLERAFLNSNRAHFRGDREGAYKAAEKAAALISEDGDPEGWDPAPTFLPGPSPANHALALEAIHTNRLETALENLPEPESGRVLRMGTWNMLLNVRHLLGHHEEELAAARMAREQYPEALHLLIREAFALIGLDSIPAALALLEEFRRRGGDHFPIEEIACQLRAHGYPELGRDVLEQHLEWLDAQPTDPETQRNLRIMRARTLYYLERWEEARPIFAELYSEAPDENNTFSVLPLGQLGVIAAHLGEREEALRISDELAAREIPGLLGWNTAWRAAIAAILGEEEQAVSLLWQSYREGFSYGIWVDYYVDLENLWDHPGFQEFARPRG